MMFKILLHTCCGPCFLGIWEGLKDSNFEVTNYFYNPNIQPESEFKKRLQNLRSAARGKSKAVIVEKFDAKEHLQAIKGLEAEFPKRCLSCYRLRLEKTAQKAKELGFDAFSTTLLVSPYQQHKEFKRIGEEVAKKIGVEFYYQDFRPYFKEGQQIAKENGIYRQKYCGCLLSKEYR